MIPIFRRDQKKQRYEVGEFAHANSNLLVIVMDPKDDSIFCAYNNRVAGGRIKMPDGKQSHVVRDLLKQSRFASNIDGTLMSIMDTLQLRRLSWSVNNVLQFIDGALWNISRRHVHKIKEARLPEGTEKSPLQPEDLVGPRKEL